MKNSPDSPALDPRSYGYEGEGAYCAGRTVCVGPFSLITK